MFYAFIAAFVLLAAPIPSAAAGIAPAPALNTLEAIDYGTLPGDRVVVRARFSKPVEKEPGLSRTFDPDANIVLDFPRTDSALRLGESMKEIDFRGVERVQVVESGSDTRLVVALDEPLTQEISLHGSDVWLILTPPRAQNRNRLSERSANPMGSGYRMDPAQRAALEPTYTPWK
jgi:hypothetical protein